MNRDFSVAVLRRRTFAILVLAVALLLSKGGASATTRTFSGEDVSTEVADLSDASTIEVTGCTFSGVGRLRIRLTIEDGAALNVSIHDNVFDWTDGSMAEAMTGIEIVPALRSIGVELPRFTFTFSNNRVTTRGGLVRLLHVRQPGGAGTEFRLADNQIAMEYLGNDEVSNGETILLGSAATAPGSSIEVLNTNLHLRMLNGIASIVSVLEVESMRDAQITFRDVNITKRGQLAKADCFGRQSRTITLSASTTTMSSATVRIERANIEHHAHMLSSIDPSDVTCGGKSDYAAVLVSAAYLGSLTMDASNITMMSHQGNAYGIRFNSRHMHLRDHIRVTRSRITTFVNGLGGAYGISANSVEGWMQERISNSGVREKVADAQSRLVPRGVVDAAASSAFQAAASDYARVKVLRESPSFIRLDALQNVSDEDLRRTQVHNASAPVDKGRYFPTFVLSESTIRIAQFNTAAAGIYFSELSRVAVSCYSSNIAIDSVLACATERDGIVATNAGGTTAWSMQHSNVSMTDDSPARELLVRTFGTAPMAPEDDAARVCLVSSRESNAVRIGQVDLRTGHIRIRDSTFNISGGARVFGLHLSGSGKCTFGFITMTDCIVTLTVTSQPEWVPITPVASALHAPQDMMRFEEAPAAGAEEMGPALLAVTGTTVTLHVRGFASLVSLGTTTNATVMVVNCSVVANTTGQFTVSSGVSPYRLIQVDGGLRDIASLVVDSLTAVVFDADDRLVHMRTSKRTSRGTLQVISATSCSTLGTLRVRNSYIHAQQPSVIEGVHFAYNLVGDVSIGPNVTVHVDSLREGEAKGIRVLGSSSVVRQSRNYFRDLTDSPPTPIVLRGVRVHASGTDVSGGIELNRHAVVNVTVSECALLVFNQRELCTFNRGSFGLFMTTLLSARRVVVERSMVVFSTPYNASDRCGAPLSASPNVREATAMVLWTSPHVVSAPLEVRDCVVAVRAAKDVRIIDARTEAGLVVENTDVLGLADGEPNSIVEGISNVGPSSVNSRLLEILPVNVSWTVRAGQRRSAPSTVYRLFAGDDQAALPADALTFDVEDNSTGVWPDLRAKAEGVPTLSDLRATLTSVFRLAAAAVRAWQLGPATLLASWSTALVVRPTGATVNWPLHLSFTVVDHPECTPASDGPSDETMQAPGHLARAVIAHRAPEIQQRLPDLPTGIYVCNVLDQRRTDTTFANSPYGTVGLVDRALLLTLELTGTGAHRATAAVFGGIIKSTAVVLMQTSAAESAPSALILSHANVVVVGRRDVQLCDCTTMPAQTLVLQSTLQLLHGRSKEASRTRGEFTTNKLGLVHADYVLTGQHHRVGIAGSTVDISGTSLAAIAASPPLSRSYKNGESVSMEVLDSNVSLSTNATGLPCGDDAQTFAFSGGINHVLHVTRSSIHIQRLTKQRDACSAGDTPTLSHVRLATTDVSAGLAYFRAQDHANDPGNAVAGAFSQHLSHTLNPMLHAAMGGPWPRAGTTTSTRMDGAQVIIDDSDIVVDGGARVTNVLMFAQGTGCVVAMRRSNVTAVGGEVGPAMVVRALVSGSSTSERTPGIVLVVQDSRFAVYDPTNGTAVVRSSDVNLLPGCLRVSADPVTGFENPYAAYVDRNDWGGYCDVGAGPVLLPVDEQTAAPPNVPPHASVSASCNRGATAGAPESRAVRDQSQTSNAAQGLTFQAGCPDATADACAADATGKQLLCNPNAVNPSANGLVLDAALGRCVCDCDPRALEQVGDSHSALCQSYANLTFGDVADVRNTTTLLPVLARLDAFCNPVCVMASTPPSAAGSDSAGCNRKQPRSMTFSSSLSQSEPQREHSPTPARTRSVAVNGTSSDQPPASSPTIPLATDDVTTRPPPPTEQMSSRSSTVGGAADPLPSVTATQTPTRIISQQITRSEDGDDATGAERDALRTPLAALGLSTTTARAVSASAMVSSAAVAVVAPTSATRATTTSRIVGMAMRCGDSELDGPDALLTPLLFSINLGGTENGDHDDDQHVPPASTTVSERVGASVTTGVVVVVLVAAWLGYSWQTKSPRDGANPREAACPTATEPAAGPRTMRAPLIGIAAMLVLSYFGPNVVELAVGTATHPDIKGAAAVVSAAAAGAVLLLCICLTALVVLSVNQDRRCDGPSADAAASQGVVVIPVNAVLLFDGTRDAGSLITRIVIMEDLLFATVVGLLGGLSEAAVSRGQCTALSLVGLAAGIAHMFYLVAVRPYQSRVELTCAIVFGVAQCALSAVATAVRLSTPEGEEVDEESTALLVLGGLELLMYAGFYLQAVVLAADEVHAFMRQRRQAAAAAQHADHEAALLVVPMASESMSPKAQPEMPSEGQHIGNEPRRSGDDVVDAAERNRVRAASSGSASGPPANDRSRNPLDARGRR